MMNGTPLPENHGGDTSHYTADAICKRIGYIQTKHRVNFFQLKRVLEEGLGHDHIAVNTKAPAKRTSKSLPLPTRKMSPFRGPFPSEFPLPSVGRVLIFSGTTQSHDRIARVMPKPLQPPITTCLQANRFYGTLARSRIDPSRICQKPRCHSGLKIDVHWAHVDISPFQFASNKED